MVQIDMRKTTVPILLLALLLLAPAPASAQESGGSLQVAVLRFAGREEPWVGTGLALLVERELLARVDVRVLDREHLDDLQREAGLAAGGLTASGGLRVAGVDVAITGQYVVAEDGTVEVAARAIDAKSGEILAEGTAAGTLGDLAKIARSLTPALLAGTDRRVRSTARRLPPVTLPEIRALAEARAAEVAGDHAGAYVSLRRGLGRSPESQALRTELGRLLVRMGEPEHAVLEYRSALAGKSRYWAATALAEMARAFEHEIENLDRAARAYRELVTRYPSVEGADRTRYREAQLLLKAGRPRDAFLALEAFRDHMQALASGSPDTSRFANPARVAAEGRIRVIEGLMRERYATLTEREQAGLEVPRHVFRLTGDSQTLTIRREDMDHAIGVPAAWIQITRFIAIAPPGRYLSKATITVDSSPSDKDPYPSEVGLEGVGIGVGDVHARFGAGDAPAGSETRSIDLGGAVPWVRMVVGETCRRFEKMTIRFETTETEVPLDRPSGWSADPPGGDPLAVGVVGGIGEPCAIHRGGETIVVFSDVAETGLGFGGRLHYPIPVGKDADLFLVRKPDGGPAANPVRLPLSSELEDLLPVIASDHEGGYRLTWLSNRRTGRFFELWTATSRDLVRFSYPKLVTLDQKDIPVRTIDSDFLGFHNMLFTARFPVLHRDREGRWWLLYQSTWGLDGWGTYIAMSDDGVRFERPVHLAEESLGVVRILDAGDGRIRVVGIRLAVPMQDLPDPGRIEVRRILVDSGGVVASDRGDLPPEFPWGRGVPLIAPLELPDGEILTGYVRRSTDGEWTLELYAVSADGEPRRFTEPIPFEFALSSAATVRTPDGLGVLLRRSASWHHDEVGARLFLREVALDLPGPGVGRPGGLVEGATPGDSGGPPRALLLPVDGDVPGPVAELVRALLAEALSGYRLVERERLDAVLENMAMEERLGATGRARIGRLAGADFVIATTVSGSFSVTVQVVDARTSEVIAEGSRTAPLTDLGPALDSLVDEVGPDGVDRSDLRPGENPSARLSFLKGVADVLAGDPELGAGRFFEALRLGRDIPQTRYWLARALESSGEKAGAVLEYTEFLERVKPGLLADSARVALARSAGSYPADEDWFPPPPELTTSEEILFGGGEGADRKAALLSLVAERGREALLILTELLRSEEDAALRMAVLGELERLDSLVFLRAVALEASRPTTDRRAIQRGLLARHEFGGEFDRCLIECLDPVRVRATGSLWRGLELVRAAAWSRLPPPSEALHETLRATLADRGGEALARAVRIASSHRYGREWFGTLLAISLDEDVPAQTRRTATSAVVGLDPDRAWEAYRSLVLEGVHAKAIAPAYSGGRLPVDSEEARELLLSPSMNGYSAALTDMFRFRFRERAREVGLEAARSESPSVRRRGLGLLGDACREKDEEVLGTARDLAARDPDPAVREEALTCLCWGASAENARGLLGRISDVEEPVVRANLLLKLASGLGARIYPVETDGIEGWLLWLEVVESEWREEWRYLNHLRSGPAEENAIALMERLSAVSLPAVVRVIARYLATGTTPRSEQARRAAFRAVERVLTSLGTPVDRIPRDEGALREWLER